MAVNTKSLEESLGRVEKIIDEVKGLKGACMPPPSLVLYHVGVAGAKEKILCENVII